MGEIGCAVQRINVPAIVAALVAESLLFTKNIVRRPLLADAFSDQHFGSAVRRRHQIGLALVFNFEMLVEMMHQQRTGLARDSGHGGEKTVVWDRHRGW